MLKIYPVMIECLKALGPVIREIERFDLDLARQLRRASASVALNVAEGSGSRGGVRQQRYRTALGSARETSACLDVSEAMYEVAIDSHIRSQLARVTNVLVHIAA